MGQFSWLDCKTKEQIVDDVRRNVYVLIPEEFGGGHILEKCYDGYGNFGGKDIYELVVDWNKDYLDRVLARKRDWECGITEKDEEDFRRIQNGLPPIQEKRWLGIVLACYDHDNVRLQYPIKITHNEKAIYEYCAPSLSDPNQGWQDDDPDDDGYDDIYDGYDDDLFLDRH